MKNMVKIEIGESNDNMKLNGKREERKISFFYKKESRVKMLDYQALLAAKVVTFNDRGKVPEYYLLQFDKIEITPS